MKELLQNENIRKCIKLFAVSLGVILVIKYLLPLFWPFVLAYFLGELVCRLSDFLNRKLQFHYKVAAIFTCSNSNFNFCIASVNYKQVIRTGTKFGRKLA